MKEKKTMEIRQANEEDIPRIIEVLKASLGESKLPKSEKIWRYKHLDNPFGKSLVLVAVEGDEIIGVRAFMRWKWQYGALRHSAFRAVDTATHPSHQGKGVFKKLTLKAIEIGKEQGDHLIFNTPNDQSLPGYLKMGWKEVGNLKVRLMPVNPLRWSLKKEMDAYQVIKNCGDSRIDRLCESHNSLTAKKESFFTPKSAAYLKWRYEENPLQEYEVFCEDGFYLAAYVKEHKRFRELRVVDHLYEGKKSLKILKKRIYTLAEHHGVQVISLGKIGKSTSWCRISGNFGPVLTFRNLSLNEDVQERYLTLANWSYSLGDLELF